MSRWTALISQGYQTPAPSGGLHLRLSDQLQFEIHVQITIDVHTVAS